MYSTEVCIHKLVKARGLNGDERLYIVDINKKSGATLVYEYIIKLAR